MMTYQNDYRGTQDVAYILILKKIRYIVSIHIPIILAVSLPLFLGWIYPDIFTPVHVIFLELVMGPMCSIV
jgi:Ca2+-transporting ATPase